MKRQLVAIKIAAAFFIAGFLFLHAGTVYLSASDVNDNVITVSILKGGWQYDENPANDYSPNVITVPLGATVVWTNKDDVPHTVTKDGMFDSGMLAQGDSWSYTFTEPGTYEYYCIPHPWMKGKVIVSDRR